MRCSWHAVITEALHASSCHYCSTACCMMTLLQSCMLHPVITAALKSCMLHAESCQNCSLTCCMLHVALSPSPLCAPRWRGDITLPDHAASLCFVSGHNFLCQDPSQWHTVTDRVTPRHTQSLSPESHWPRQNTSLGQSWSTYLLVINNPHSYLWEHTLIINVSCQIVAWARANLFWHQNV